MGAKIPVDVGVCGQSASPLLLAYGLEDGRVSGVAVSYANRARQSEVVHNLQRNQCTAALVSRLSISVSRSGIAAYENHRQTTEII